MDVMFVSPNAVKAYQQDMQNKGAFNALTGQLKSNMVWSVSLATHGDYTLTPNYGLGHITLNVTPPELETYFETI